MCVCVCVCVYVFVGMHITSIIAYVLTNSENAFVEYLVAVFIWCIRTVHYNISHVFTCV